MSDGGEGLLDALGGRPHLTTVAGPLGDPVDAEWRMLDDGAESESEAEADADGPTAVVEMSRAAGRPSSPSRTATTPCGRTRPGWANCSWPRRRGARRIVIGCGGSATTDGGLGAVTAVGSAEALRGIELVVACDVTTAFTDAATVFGPQKGATPGQVGS